MRQDTNATQKKPSIATIDIVDMTHDGRGVGKVEGKTVFVDGALRGERVSARIVKRRRKYDQARVLDVIAPSADRVVAHCDVFGVCGGCALQHQAIAAQRDAKRAALKNALTKIGNVEPTLWLDDLTASPWAYRRKARLGVKYVAKKERVLVGFRERLAPYITDMRRCEVLAEPVGGLLDALAELIAGLSLRAALPQIEVAIGDAVTALVLRVLTPPTASDRAALADFGRRHDVDIWLQSGGPDSVEALGEARELVYTLPEFDISIHFTPTDFVQVHGELNRLMVGKVVDYLDLQPDSKVLDLFCGLGNFTLPLARRAGRVVGVEGDAALVSRARDNARRNDIGNAEFYSADLFAADRDWTWPQSGYHRVLLDPPRSGAQEVLTAVARSGAGRVVYVSCHPGTLARDAQILVGEQGFVLDAAGIMDMFPHTAHVESVAIFSRPDGGD